MAMGERRYEIVCVKGHGSFLADSPFDECPACADDQPPCFNVGDRVFWADPDCGIGSGAGEISQIKGDVGKEMGEDSLVTVMLDGGGEVVAPASELSLCLRAVTQAVLTVEYDLNGTPVSELLGALERGVGHLSGNGVFSGDSPAEVDRWQVRSNVVAAPESMFCPVNDEEGTPLGVENYIEGARRHGEDDDPDHEVGDLQELFRAAYGLLSPSQRAEFGRLPEVEEMRDVWGVD